MEGYPRVQPLVAGHPPEPEFWRYHTAPLGRGERTQQEVQAEFQEKISRIAGMEMFAFGTPPLPGFDAGLPVSFVVASTEDYEEVKRVGEELVKAATESGLFVFVTQSLDFDRPEIKINIDRELAARLGISMRDDRPDPVGDAR